MKNFKKNYLDKLQSMNYEEKKIVISKLPIKMATYLYSRYCDIDQIKSLLIDWDLIASEPLRAIEFDKNFQKVQTHHKKKIISLIKALKKKRESHIIPLAIKTKYQ